MLTYKCWTFPDVPPEINELLFQNDKKLVVVGVIGKSAFADANKMIAFNVLDRQPSLLEHTPAEGQIQFYYNPQESMLLLHFETTYDTACMKKILQQAQANEDFGQFLIFNKNIRNRFARMLLFATQVCHIVVFVELSITFDASLLSIFRSLKIIRDKHILKFLPKLVKNSSTASFLGKSARLCSPRIIFLFENYPDNYEKTMESISKLEFEVEDNIYKMLRNEFIITNNSSMSLFSIPSNKRFVFFNTDQNLREDPLLKSVNFLNTLLEKSNQTNDTDDDMEDLRPFKGFGAPLIQCRAAEVNTVSAAETIAKERQFMHLLKDHVDEALQTGFDDNTIKFKSKNHFVVLAAKPWYETFKMLHKIFIENPDNPKFEANDVDYKAYLENFDKIMDIDNEFFKSCCDIGLQKAFAMYKNPALTHYSGVVHKRMTEEAVSLYLKYARGPQMDLHIPKLREMCESCWQNGKQQCEFPSLRGNACVLPKHIVKDVTEHSSAHVFISACNCGRTQGRREDPYTIRHANYEFYEYMANNCNLCAKVKKIHFAVFEPSINDYRAAEFEIAFPKLTLRDASDLVPCNGASDSEHSDNDMIDSQPASQSTHTNLSLDATDHLKEIVGENADDSDDSLDELVIHVKDKETKQEEAEKERSILRQPSTTEYLPGMVHTKSPIGLLPQYPSWSLVCVGPSSVYSHNTGLLEHFQSGFLSGANYLLPWDVHVRLEHSASWAYEKTRLRKMGEVFILKIFVGCEYECPRGHRFMLNAPDKVLRSGSGILRDSGSKVVYNNMPLYFPCPCRAQKANVAQLMRVHVVTPKAPVNVILDPKVRTGEHEYVFTLGLPSPPKLTQSAYWILRLPYIYQGDEGTIAPPSEVTSSNAINYGCLLANMFGVSEQEVDE